MRRKKAPQIILPPSNRAIRSTGNGGFWNRMLVKKRLDDQQYLLGPSSGPKTSSPTNVVVVSPSHTRIKKLKEKDTDNDRSPKIGTSTTHKSVSIRSTGDDGFWKRMLEKKHLDDQRFLRGPPSIDKSATRASLSSDTKVENEQQREYFTNVSGEIDGVNGEGEADEEESVTFTSENYYVLKGNKSISYGFGCTNPREGLTILDYDAFPVYVGGDKCLIRIEVRDLYCEVELEKYL